jgi:thiamine-monophosphate kinase
VPIAEKALIAQVRRWAKPARNAAVQTGIGDDCAVLRILPVLRNKTKGKDSQDILITTDFSLEGIHFRREWHAPESVGHRCLARGLSDIAAMGGIPVAAFLSLALPRDVKPEWVQSFARGLLKLAKKHGVTLAGGDTAESPGGVLVDIVVVGAVPKGKATLRSRAQAGDNIYVSGELGGSAAAVGFMRDELRKKRPQKPDPREYPRHFFPAPRIEVGRFLRENNLASAMIDTSDGLSTDLAHICEESGAGAEIEGELIPLALLGKPAVPVDLQLALHGGEDYELLFTAPRNKKVPPAIAGVPITRIGRITRRRQIYLVDVRGRRSKLHAQGWEHFRQ